MSNKICVNCRGSTQDSLFCKACGYIVPIPARVNYFELLSLPPTIALEFQAVQSSYFKLQSLMHPDRFTNKPKEELQIAMANSAVINNAYKILSDKFERAQYLVSLHANLEAKVPADFMALAFSLHESKSEGNDIGAELNAINASLWEDLDKCIESGAWEQASVVIAKLKTVVRLSK